MRHGAQKFHRVAFFLHRIIRRGFTCNLNFGCVNLKRLLCLRSFNQFSGYNHGGSAVQSADFVKIIDLILIKNNLKSFEV